MSNLRDIKQRIVSVKKTKKITQAMKMVAAAKFKRSQKKLDHAKEYGQALRDILADMAARLEEDGLPELMLPNGIEKEAVVIIAGDRGLCGGFNNNILKAALTYIQEKGEEKVELYLIGNKTASFFKSKPFTIAANHTHIIDGINEEGIKPILAPIIEGYIQKKYGKVKLFYNEFVSAITNNQEQKQLLPLNLEGWDPKKHLNQSDYQYEADKKSVLGQFVSEYVVYEVFEGMLNSQAAEEGSRMAAMDSASQNATDVVYDLTLQYNRSRQAAITTEISEIVAGAASL
ncbi:ATP synthase F1 subunit gamma [Candidatus Marinamargulisbacteria bacterium SCGC AG-439-L15]|nr:ATP synthase F1 subunit gamma [Candidatus Marinamargulisbacteria bacterium SCGC AG-439-L15]